MVHLAISRLLLLVFFALNACHTPGNSKVLGSDNASFEDCGIIVREGASDIDSRSPRFLHSFTILTSTDPMIRQQLDNVPLQRQQPACIKTDRRPLPGDSFTNVTDLQFFSFGACRAIIERVGDRPTFRYKHGFSGRPITIVARDESLEEYLKTHVTPPATQWLGCIFSNEDPVDGEHFVEKVWLRQPFLTGIGTGNQ